MNLAHVTSLLSVGGGGIPSVVFPLARAQISGGVPARVVGVADPLGRAIGDCGVPYTVYPHVGPLALGCAPGIGTDLATASTDLVHLHGLFTWPSRQATAWTRATGRPRIVSPHGMLDPWALRRSRLKKRIFSWLVENANLRSAGCFHALCEQEANDIRAAGVTAPVAVIPNGVDLATIPSAIPRSQFDDAFPRSRGRPLLVFLGRIHPKKGVELLLRAWGSMKQEGRLARDGWLLVIAGPDQVGDRSGFERLCTHLDIGPDVLFTGPLYGEHKWRLLHAGAGFVLPSLSEGLPVAMLEAMAASLPVLLSRQCNLDADALGVGLLCDPSTTSVGDMLRTFLSTSQADRLAMGVRGHHLVRSRFTWTVVAEEMVRLYAWMLGGGERPAAAAR